MKSCLFILLLCLLTSIGQTQSVVNFSKDLKKICPLSNDIFAKKIFITILKLEKRALDPCEDDALNKLLVNCSERDCPTIVRVYRDAVYKHEGKVIGQ